MNSIFYLKPHSMTNEEKQMVRNALMRYVSGFPTQGMAAESLQGISAPVISNVKNDNWEAVSEQMWHNLAKLDGYYSPGWNTANTGAYLLLNILLRDARHFGAIHCAGICSGQGKTYVAQQYKLQYNNVLYVTGSEPHNKRSFFTALFHALGLTGHPPVFEMTELLAAKIHETEQPLLIIDDAHLLKDRVLHAAVLLAQKLEGVLGVLFLGDHSFKSRIANGFEQKKAGYDEIYKVLYSKFIGLPNDADSDIELVCRANGITGMDSIAKIISGSSGDLHQAVQFIRQWINTGSIVLKHAA